MAISFLIANKICKMQETVATEQSKINDLQKQIQELINKPSVREDALTNAKFFEEEFRGNWFTVDQVMKKTKMKRFEAVLDILTLLCFMNLAYREEKSPGIIKYKITLNDQDRLVFLQEELAQAKTKVNEIQGYIDQITKNIQK